MFLNSLLCLLNNWINRNPNKPYRAVDAPAVIVSGFNNMTAKFPPTPDIIYNSENFKCPIIFSMSVPNVSSSTIFDTKCGTPICANIGLIKRHHSAGVKQFPKMAPFWYKIVLFSVVPNVIVT